MRFFGLLAREFGGIGRLLSGVVSGGTNVYTLGELTAGGQYELDFLREN